MTDPGVIFLSTPSARRATAVRIVNGVGIGISIHALREEGDSRKTRDDLLASDISIHALREEGDVRVETLEKGGKQFLSTPSARRATEFRHSWHPFLLISIHALREEGDQRLVPQYTQTTLFLSTPSARRATCAIR